MASTYESAANSTVAVQSTNTSTSAIPLATTTAAVQPTDTSTSAVQLANISAAVQLANTSTSASLLANTTLAVQLTNTSTLAISLANTTTEVQSTVTSTSAVQLVNITAAVQLANTSTPAIPLATTTAVVQSTDTSTSANLLAETTAAVQSTNTSTSAIILANTTAAVQLTNTPNSAISLANTTTEVESTITSTSAVQLANMSAAVQSANTSTSASLLANTTLDVQFTSTSTSAISLANTTAEVESTITSTSAVQLANITAAVQSANTSTPAIHLETTAAVVQSTDTSTSAILLTETTAAIQSTITSTSVVQLASITAAVQSTNTSTSANTLASTTAGTPSANTSAATSTSRSSLTTFTSSMSSTSTLTSASTSSPPVTSSTSSGFESIAGACLGTTIREEQQPNQGACWSACRSEPGCTAVNYRKSDETCILQVSSSPRDSLVNSTNTVCLVACEPGGPCISVSTTTTSSSTSPSTPLSTSKLTSASTSKLTSASTSKLTSASTSKLTSASTSKLTSASTSKLTSASTSKLTLASTSKLTSASTSKLTSASTSKLTSASTSKLTSESTSKLTSASTSKLTSASTSKLTSASTSKLTSASTSKLTSASTSMLTSASTSKLTSASTSKLTSASTSKLTSASTSKLTSASTSMLTSASTSKLTSASTSMLTSASTSKLTSASTSKLTSASTSKLTSASTSKLTSASTSKLTSASTSKLTSTSTSKLTSASTTSPPVTSSTSSGFESIAGACQGTTIREANYNNQGACWSACRSEPGCTAVNYRKSDKTCILQVSANPRESLANSTNTVCLVACEPGGPCSAVATTATSVASSSSTTLTSTSTAAFTSASILTSSSTSTSLSTLKSTFIPTSSLAFTSTVSTSASTSIPTLTTTFRSTAPFFNSTANTTLASSSSLTTSTSTIAPTTTSTFTITTASTQTLPFTFTSKNPSKSTQITTSTSKILSTYARASTLTSTALLSTIATSSPSSEASSNTSAAVTSTRATFVSSSTSASFTSTSFSSPSTLIFDSSTSSTSQTISTTTSTSISLLTFTRTSFATTTSPPPTTTTIASTLPTSTSTSTTSSATTTTTGSGYIVAGIAGTAAPPVSPAASTAISTTTSTKFSASSTMTSSATTTTSTTTGTTMTTTTTTLVSTLPSSTSTSTASSATTTTTASGYIVAGTAALPVSLAATAISTITSTKTTATSATTTSGTTTTTSTTTSKTMTMEPPGPESGRPFTLEEPWSSQAAGIEYTSYAPGENITKLVNGLTSSDEISVEMTHWTGSMLHIMLFSGQTKLIQVWLGSNNGTAKSAVATSNIDGSFEVESFRLSIFEGVRSKINIKFENGGMKIHQKVVPHPNALKIRRESVLAEITSIQVQEKGSQRTDSLVLGLHRTYYVGLLEPLHANQWRWMTRYGEADQSPPFVNAGKISDAANWTFINSAGVEDFPLEESGTGTGHDVAFIARPSGKPYQKISRAKDKKFPVLCIRQPVVPIDGRFTIDISKTLLLGDINAKLYINYPKGFDIPSPVMASINWDENLPTQNIRVIVPSVACPCRVGIPHRFATLGSKIISVSLSNEDGSTNITAETAVINPIIALRVEVSYSLLDYDYAEPSDVLAGQKEPLGLLRDHLPELRTTILRPVITWADGYNNSATIISVLYKGDVSGAELRNKWRKPHDEDYFTAFLKPWQGSLTVEASVHLWGYADYPVQAVAKTYTVHPMLRGITISDDRLATERGGSKDFTIGTLYTFENSHDHGCMRVDMGDGSPMLTYGIDEATCCLAVPCEFKAGHLTERIFQIRQQYKTDGIYRMNVSAWNLFSQTWTDHNYTIFAGPVACRLPRVEIVDAVSDVQRANSKSLLYPFVMEAKMEIDCDEDAVFDVKREWRTAKYAASGDFNGWISLAESIVLNRKRLFMPAFVVEMGYHRFMHQVKLTLQSNGSDTAMFAVASTYVRMTPPPPVLVLVETKSEGGKAPKLGLVELKKGGSLELKPGTLSYPPGKGPGYLVDYASMDYYCRQLEDEEGARIDEEPFTAYPDGTVTGGPGKIKGFNNSEETLSREDLEPGLYEIFVVMHLKGGRAPVSDSIAVRVLDDVTEDFQLGLVCHKANLCPIDRQGAYRGHVLNKGGRITLVGYCGKRPCSSYAGATYNWTFHYFNETDDVLGVSPLGEAQEFSQEVQAGDRYQMTLKENFFDKSSRAYYAVKFKFARSKYTTSHVVLYFKRNDPPVNGSCSVFPKTGNSNTEFTVNCSGWFDDPHEVKYYQAFADFALTTDGETIEKVITTSFDRLEYKGKLLVGPTAAGFSYPLKVRIVDNIGAAVVVVAGIVTVETTEGQQDAARRKLREAVRFKDVPKATAAANEFMDNWLADTSQIDNCNLEEQRCHEIDKNATDCQAKYTQCLENMYAENSKIRGDLLKQLSDPELRPQIPGEVSQLATVVSAVLEKKEEVHVAGMNDSIAQLDRMMDLLRKQTDTMPPEDVDQVARQITLMTGRQIEVVKASLRGPKPKAFDTSLPADPGDILYLEEHTEEQLAQEISTNGFYQVGATMAPQIELTDELLTRALAFDTAIGGSTQEKMDSAEFVVRRGRASETLRGTVIGSGFRVKFPPGGICDLTVCNGTDDAEREIILKVDYKRGNTYEYANSDGTIDSGSSAIKIYDANNTEIEVKHAKLPIEIYIDRLATTDDPEADTWLVANISRHSVLTFHKVNRSDVEATVKVELRKSNPTAELRYYIRFDEYPAPMPGWYNLSGSIPAGVNATLKFDKSSLGNFTGTFVLGLAQLLSGSNNSTDILKVTDGNHTFTFLKQFTTNYSLQMYSAGCYFYNNKSNNWDKSGCRLGPETTAMTTHCLCDHLTSFASGLFVAPNKIDFSYVFRNAGIAANPAIYVCLGVIFTVFFILLLILRRLDTDDILKLGITPLPDNNIKHQYLYQIAVRTGLRRNAATDSRVQFALSGDNSTATTREMGDALRPTFRRGQTNNFLMATEGPLGELDFLRIWHDGSGRGAFASWYLCDAAVQDLQTGQKWAFVASTWIGVDAPDGMMERVLPVSNDSELASFDQLFSGKSKHELSDSHLWFSIFTRPPTSKFTRVQRLACCLCVLVSTMLTSAMWYGRVPEGRPTNAIDIGPLTISPETLFVAVMSNLIVFPINFIIMLLFRKARRRVPQAEQVKKCTERHGRLNKDLSKREKVIDLEADLMSKKKKPFSLPWWCRYVAWTICILTILTCVFFVFLYAIQFGNVTTKKWLSSIIAGFFSSVVFSQTLKILFMAVFCACLCKNRALVEDEEYMDSLYVLAHDEQYLHKIATEEPRPITEDREVAEHMRALQLKEQQMSSVLKELGLFAGLAIVVVIMSHGTASSDGYALSRNLRSLLMGDETRKLDWNETRCAKCFMHVTNRTQLFEWLDKTFIRGIRAPRWYNNQPALMQRGYFADRVTRILGYATIRQVRVNNDICATAINTTGATGECTRSASMTSQEKRDFGPGWQPLSELPNRPFTSHYAYRPSSVTKALPLVGQRGVYGGGGYVADLRGTVKEMEQTLQRLQRERWIDRRTRLVKVDVAGYNAFAHRFVAATAIAEMAPDGGIVRTVRVEPLGLLAYQRGLGVVLFAAEIAFVLVVICVIIKEINAIRSLGFRHHYRKLWSWAEAVFIFLGVAIVAVYIRKRLVERDIVEGFEKTHGNYYVNLEEAIWWQDTYRTLLAFILFLTTAKLTRLLRFNSRLMLITATIKQANKRVMQSGGLMIIIFGAYSSIFHLTLGKQDWRFATMLRSVETSFSILLGKKALWKFDEGSIIAALAFLGFALTMVIVMLNMLITLLNDMFIDVKDHVNRQGNEHEIFSYIMERSKRAMGMKAKGKLNIYKYNELPVTRALTMKTGKLLQRIELQVHT